MLGGRRDLGRIFFMTLSKSSGEVRAIYGSSGTVAGFQVVSPLSPAAFDML